jgi:hypothetical protein
MLNEHDLKDFERLPVRELYKCKPRSYVEVPELDNLVLFFDHIDGMYSFCRELDNGVTHIACWTKVVPLQPKTD